VPHFLREATPFFIGSGGLQHRVVGEGALCEVPQEASPTPTKIIIQGVPFFKGGDAYLHQLSGVIA